MHEEGTTRRTVLAGVCGAGLTAALAGCSTYGGSSDEPAAPAPSSPGTTTGPPVAVAKVADIPVGGGKVVTAPNGQPVVIVQPAAGEIKAFTAVCTHEGETVAAPQNSVMRCPRHGSRFNATDGSVVNGPAGRPLKPVAVTVTGEDITLT